LFFLSSSIFWGILFSFLFWLVMSPHNDQTMYSGDNKLMVLIIMLSGKMVAELEPYSVIMKPGLELYLHSDLEHMKRMLEDIWIMNMNVDLEGKIQTRIFIIMNSMRKMYNDLNVRV